jgi:hypothetical protein
MRARCRQIGDAPISCVAGNLVSSLGSGSKERAGRQLSGEVNGTRANPARRTRRFGLNQAPRTPVKSPAPH